MPRACERSLKNSNATKASSEIWVRVAPALTPLITTDISISSAARSRQFIICGPTIKPALLPKSEMIAPGPNSLMSAMGLLAISTPTWIEAIQFLSSSRVFTGSEGRRGTAVRMTNSASTAAKPFSKTLAVTALESGAVSV